MLINHWRQVQNGIQNFASTSVAAPPIFHSINACMYCLVVGVSASEYHIFTLKCLFIKLCKTQKTQKKTGSCRKLSIPLAYVW